MLRALHVIESKTPSSDTCEVVEQIFDAPLWYARVLPAADFDAQGEVAFRPWRRFVSASVQGILGIVRRTDWETAQVHVLLPDRTTTTGLLKLFRCRAILVARAVHAFEQDVWIIETDTGTFVEPATESQTVQTRKGIELWRSEATN